MHYRFLRFTPSSEDVGGQFTDAAPPKEASCSLKSNGNIVSQSSTISKEESSETLDELKEAAICCNYLSVLKSQPTEKIMVINVAFHEVATGKAMIDTMTSVSLMHGDLIDVSIPPKYNRV